MAETVVKQATEGPAVAFNTLRRTPVLAIGLMFIVLFVVLLLEAYKPGLLTGPVKRLLNAIGVKNA
jgi:hypothetical protein